MRSILSRRVTGMLAFGLVLAAVSGCSSSEESRGESSTDAAASSGPTTSPEPMSTVPSSFGASPAAGGTLTPQEMQEVVARQRALEQKKQEVARQYVQIANRYTEEGRLREALQAYAQALEMSPKDPEAQSGYERVSALLQRNDRAFAAPWDVAKAGVQQAGTMARERFQKGTTHYNAGDYDRAIEEFRNTLAILKAQPAVSADFDESRVRAAIADAERARELARQKDEGERLREIQSIQREREEREQKRAREAVERTWSRATQAFERDRFAECETLCGQVLQLDPLHQGALELTELARRARHVSATERNVSSYREEWERTLQQIKDLSMPFGGDPVYPSLDKWRKISRRGPIELSRGSGQVDEGDEQIRRTLEGTILSVVDWRDTQLADAVKFLRNNTGINFITKAAVDGEGGVPEESRVLNLEFVDISAYSALQNALKSINLTFEIRDRMVQITTLEDLRKNKIVEYHDVRDLTAKIASFPGEEFNLNPSGVGGADLFADDAEEEEENVAIQAEQLIEMIQKTVDPSSWEDDTTNTITDKSGTLVVRQTPENQRAIRKLLGDLRKSIGVQVRIQARFISVENNFLQDIGVDFRGLGDNSGGIGVPGRGTRVTLDDFGQPGQNLVLGTDLSSGVFFSGDEDIRARTQNLFDLALGNPQVLTPTGGLSLQYTYLDNTQVEAILRAVQKYERVNQVTAPSLTVYNTQRANLQVTRELAFLKDFDVEIAQASVIADPVVDVVREGVVMDVRPIVHADRRYVTLELRPTVATLQRPIRLFTTTLGTGSSVTFEVPELRKESLRTTVVMPDGGTILLGGLKFFEEQDYEAGIPILKDIPILSWFFSRKGKYTNMRDLIVLLKVDIVILEEHEPTIVRN